MEPLAFDHPYARDMLAQSLLPILREAHPRKMLDLEHDNRWRAEELVKPCGVENFVAPEHSASFTLPALAGSQDYKGYFDLILAVGTFERLMDAKEGFEQLKYLLNERDGRLVIVYRDYDATMATYAQAKMYRHAAQTHIQIGQGVPSSYMTVRRPNDMASLAHKAGFEILCHWPISIPHWIASQDVAYKQGDTYFHLMALRCI